MKHDRPTPDEARVIIAYHERMIARSTSPDRIARSQRAIARMRTILAEAATQQHAPGQETQR